MRTERENNQTVAYLEGRIDSANAEEAQRELELARQKDPDRELVLDAGALQYISSSGLRVLMKLTKEQGKPLKVRNVTPEVYDILHMTGFTDLLRVSRKPRGISVEGCEIVGKGAIGTVYRIDEDTIVKVYDLPDSLPMIEREQKRAKQAFLKGIPTAISYDVVRVGDRYGSVFEMLKAVTYNDVLRDHPDRLEEIVRDYAAFLRQVHAVEMERGELPDARGIFLGYLNDLRGGLPEDISDRMRLLLEAMPENLHLVHGDFQMKNVMLSGDEPMLIDMDTLSVGDPVFDLMGIYMAYMLFNEDEPDNSEKFLGISKEMCDAVWETLLKVYFGDRDEAEIPGLETKIRALACVRFLYLLLVMGIGKPELKQIRVTHTLDHLRELLSRTDSLEIM